MLISLSCRYLLNFFSKLGRASSFSFLRRVWYSEMNSTESGRLLTSERQSLNFVVISSVGFLNFMILLLASYSFLFFPACLFLILLSISFYMDFSLVSISANPTSRRSGLLFSNSSTSTESIKASALEFSEQRSSVSFLALSSIPCCLDRF